MPLYDEDEPEYKPEEEDEFDELASELFPDVDTDKLKRLIEICVENDMKKHRDKMRGDDDDKGGIALILGGPPKKK